MSNIINKTLNLAVSSLSTKPIEMMDSTTFLQSLSLLKNNSNQVCQFLEQLKKFFPSLSTLQQQQYLPAIVYCAYLSSSDNAIKNCVMELGTEVITFIEQSKTFYQKKIGYLVLTSLFSYTSKDLVYLAVNTILKDATSKYNGVVTTAINVICSLMTTDLVPVFLPVIEQRLSHQDPIVRIKCVHALHCMYKVGSEFVKNTKQHIKMAITDRHPEVMAASLPYVHDVVKVLKYKFDIFFKFGVYDVIYV